MHRSDHRATLPVRRKLLYAAVTTAVFFGLLELTLLALGVDPAFQESDPGLGFSGQSPLFTPSESPSGQPVLATAENRLPWFNRQSFLRDKPPGAYRIFCLGGSTTYGRPYDDRTSFAGFLRAFLAEMDPSRPWEVINAGGISYASYRIEVLIRELAQYEPDLFVIYTGHNEFLEDRTYSSVIDTPESIRRVVGLGRWSRTFSLAERLLRGTPEAPNRPVLPAEVEAILDRSVGPAAYHRDDRWRGQVLAHFRSSLERIVDVAQDAGAEIICVVPASNLRDCTPFKSEHRDGLTSGELREFLAHLRAAEQALAAGKFGEAVSRIDRAVQLDPRHAAAHYLRGRTLIETGDKQAARRAFVRAREEDVCPLRACEAIQDTVRAVAAERRLAAIDFAALVDRESQHGIPGADWFLDHVHPTSEGNARIARELAGELIRIKAVRPQPSWTPDGFERVAERVLERIDPRDHAVALRNLAKVLNWAGKVVDADRLALEAAEHLPDDAEAQRMAGFARLRLDRTAEAKPLFEAALRSGGDDARALCGLGEVYTRLGQHEAARDCFARAVAVDPKHVPAQYNLGNALRTLGQLDEAEAAYRAAIALAPEQPDAHKNLGLVLFALGDVEGTVRHFEAALALEDHVPQRHADLGYVLIDAGQQRRAEAEFQAALAIEPAFVPALFGWALLCEKRGDLARATQLLREAIRVAPQDVNAHYYLARYALQRDDAATARAELETVLTLDPSHAEARRLRAEID
ncbi:MAG: tetratricopeptide repeat protein [Candidatus Anammoximicrobium sp.]|nr:tetratricopeptide repeat protein [Candidatus Anammoximicrobium sp.]